VSWEEDSLPDFSSHVEKPALNLTPQLLTKAPASLLGKGENSKPLSRVGERFSTSREKLEFGLAIACDSCVSPGYISSYFATDTERMEAENAGQNGAVIAERVKELDLNTGYNAATDEFVDMFEAGIVDPAKVTRAAVQNAASIAGMVLTTECIVVDKPEPKAKAPAGAGAGMGGDFDY